MENTFPPLLRRLWRTARPWLIPIAIVILLRLTGTLGIISELSGAILMKTGLLNASTDEPAVMHEFPYNFLLRDMDGNVVDVSGLQNKTLFINVWATWCGPCRVEMPSIDALYRDSDTSRVAFLMISIDEEHDGERVRQFVQDKGFSFSVYRAMGALPQILRVRSIPSTFVVRNGKVIVHESGLANYDTKTMRTLLNSR